MRAETEGVRTEIVKGREQGTRPFLSIVTRCYRRPKLLAACRDSVAALSDRDWEQVLIFDDVGRGLSWADDALGEFADLCSGDYVMVLDDDDVLTDPDALTLLKRVAKREQSPPGIIFRGLVCGNVMPPRDRRWGKEIQCYKIGSFCYCLRRDVYRAHVHECRGGEVGDYRLIAAVVAHEPDVVWQDSVLAATQRKSSGRAGD